ncbi:MAG: hypothetical protein E6Q24_15715 [Chitinophagaceae bacterium]|nr:MAG: hypothetical protein E6Q24_15715 [Chitinophagaceae bacterium]
MDPKANNYFSAGEVIEFFHLYINYVLKKWWIVLLIVLLGGAAGMFYGMKQKQQFEGVTTFILEEKSGGNGGGLAGVASQFGINIGGIGGGSFLSGDNIINIIASRSIVKKVLTSKIDSQSVRTLAGLYLDFSGLKEKWKRYPAVAALDLNRSAVQKSPIGDSILNILYEVILKKHLGTERVSKQGTLYKVTVSSSNSLFSRLMSERLVSEAAQLYLDVKIGTAEMNIRQLQARADSILILLNRKSFSVAATQPIDVNPGLRSQIVPTEIATRDKTVLSTLYAEVVKNLEASKLIMSQQAPVIQVIDSPSQLLEDQKKGKTIFVLAFGILAGLLTLLVMGVKYSRRSIKTRANNAA